MRTKRAMLVIIGVVLATLFSCTPPKGVIDTETVIDEEFYYLPVYEKRLTDK